MKIPVCVFAKPPVAGRTKSRLAAAIGNERAAELAAAMLCDVWDAVSAVPGVYPVLAAAEIGWFPPRFSEALIWMQGDSDLGKRLERMLGLGLTDAPAAMAVGSDLPELKSDHVRAALRALQTHDSVLGPSPDGGYYLLGLRRVSPGLLEDLPWSGRGTRKAAEARLRERGYSHTSDLPAVHDVDTEDDLKLLLCNANAAGRATRAWLERYRLG